MEAKLKHRRRKKTSYLSGFQPHHMIPVVSLVSVSICSFCKREELHSLLCYLAALKYSALCSGCVGLKM